ncbi:homeobox protein PKNOX1 isoform X1 [Pygocentrus nattereri]|nr:homeobox protein PKNOX1 isoform X1 [Pygocentrus nattereri]
MTSKSWTQHTHLMFQSMHALVPHLESCGAETGCARNAQVLSAATVTMMTSPSVAMEEFQEAEQMQEEEHAVGETKEQLEEEEEKEEEESDPVPAEPQTPMEAQKAAIYRHPLFPLLALLFEKCEQSTQSSECVTSASFDVDIQNFVRSQEKESKAFFSEDPELDSLMVKAIQVLRIHLLELEKVNDLCKDFCSRYIACLKTKMNSETLLSSTDPGSPYSPTQTPSSFAGTVSPQGIVVPASALQQGSVTVTTVNPTQVVSGGTVYQPVTVVTPEGQMVTQALSPGTIHIQNSQLQLQLNQDLSFLSQDEGSSKSKRGILPKHATSIMRSWLFQHIGHPYPTEDEKKQIALQTNLTLLQVNNWFINARRRILQPMLDASSSDTPKSKKKTPQTRPLQRFWPDSLASTVSQQQVAMEDGTMVAVGMVTGEDGLQTLTSDGATLAMQQVMMGGHSEDDDEDDEDEEDNLSHSDMTRLGLETSDSL